LAVKVLIASPLRSYTGERAWVEASGATLAQVLADLDRRYPGIRFRMIDEQQRMRRHVRFFVNGEQAFDLDQKLAPTDELCIVQALSGG
jgi:molybdopterin converting factor small subunit